MPVDAISLDPVVGADLVRCEDLWRLQMCGKMRSVCDAMRRFHLIVCCPVCGWERQAAKDTAEPRGLFGLVKKFIKKD